MRLGGGLVLDTLCCTGRAGSFSAVLRLPLAVLVTSLHIIAVLIVPGVLYAVGGRYIVYTASSECPLYVTEPELQFVPGRPAVHIIGRAGMVVLCTRFRMPEQVGRLRGQMALYVPLPLLHREVL